MAHPHDHHKGSGHHAPNKSWKPHRDWRTWVGLVLMLAALLVYVLTQDESRLPGGKEQAPVIAAP